MPVRESADDGYQARRHEIPSANSSRNWLDIVPGARGFAVDMSLSLMIDHCAGLCRSPAQPHSSYSALAV
jgi:hypothetical protein